MKNKLYLLGSCILIILAACQKLDREIITDFNRSLVTSVQANVGSLLNGVYIELREGFLDVDDAMMASATDEAEHVNENSLVQTFNNGSWNAVVNPNNVWGSYFRGIRKANVFLVSADSINLDQFKLDPSPSQQSVYNTRLAEITRWKYEARFLRAFFYFELVKRYGGVPIITTPLSEADIPALKRNSLQECINFITSECDSAVANLPVVYSIAATDFSRATRGAALALKARTLLYAGSELFNNPSWAAGYAQPLLVSLPAGDRVARWKAAADAAKAVIDLPGTGYGLVTNYTTLFRQFNNTEIIFSRRAASSNSFERENLPIGFGGRSGTNPTQDMVDAYEIKTSATTSVKFDWNNPAHAANPYATTGATARDPRLFSSILVNNANFTIPGVVGRPNVAEIFPGGRDGQPIPNATKTGYYLRKYVNESLNISTNGAAVHSWIYFRIAEMYLNYAEALNEYSPGHADIKINYDRVRTRTGVAMPPLPAGLSQAEVRERIRSERRVEFAFEDHRAWDVRRWMIAPTTLGAPMRGVNITRPTTTTFAYAPVVVESRVFQNKMYLYPIPQGELNIVSGFIQNPMW